MEATTEIRKLPPAVICQLVRILETQDDWKKLMAMVPKDIVQNGEYQVPKYKVEHIKLIEQAGSNQKRPCSEIFLEEWGTSGKKRPDLSFLIHMLGKAELFRAADYITDLLKAPPLERPIAGPSAPVDVSPETMQKLVVRLPLPPNKLNPDRINNNDYHLPVDTDEINRAIEEMSIPDGSLPSLNDSDRQRVTANNSYSPLREYSRTPESKAFGEQETVPVDQLDRIRNAPLQVDTTIPHINYIELDNCTDHFNEDPQISGGRKLGSGAFGAVYLGTLSQKPVAVKKLNRDAVNAEKQFRNEVESLSRFRHPNLLRLLGYSCDSDLYCLVYEYMCNGSLQSRLACEDERVEVLGWETRLNIALGTARGILYLHSAYEKPLIHRDIKSANILLDEHMTPKLGDFGLVRLGKHQGNSMTMTTTVLGTSAYMAPEAFRGDVSVKLDTFSFGVVLIEILTGLPPYDEEREGHDLVTHIEAMCEDTGTIGDLLDARAGDWGAACMTENAEMCSLVDSLYSLAQNCIQDSRQKRPAMSPVVQWLETIVSLIKR